MSANNGDGMPEVSTIAAGLGIIVFILCLTISGITSCNAKLQTKIAKYKANPSCIIQ